MVVAHKFDGIFKCYILSDGQVQPVENRGKIFGMSKTLLISLVALLGVLAVAVSIGALVTSSQPARKDCKGDKFNAVKYNHSDAGKREERFLKYLFVEDEENDDFYDFAKAKVKKPPAFMLLVFCSDVTKSSTVLIYGSFLIRVISLSARQKLILLLY